MYKKHIEHFITVSLRYFLNFDYSFFQHTFLVAIVALYFLRIVIARIGNEFHDSILTIKDDAYTVKKILMSWKEIIEKSTIYQALPNNVRFSRNQ